MPQLGAAGSIHLLFADGLVLLSSSQKGLQHAFNRLSAAYNLAGMKISIKKTEVLWLSRKPRQCTLQVNGNTLQQVEKVEHLVVVCTSDGRRNADIDTRIGSVNVVLRELLRFVVTKREFSNTANLSVFKSVLFQS